MDESTVNEILDELISSLEPLDAQNTAILHFLKAKGIATDEDLAPFVEHATNASNVRWRAFRLRTAALISSAMKAPEKETQRKEQPAKSQATGAASDRQQKDQQPAEPTPEAPAAVNEETSGQNKNRAPKEQQTEAA
jgi:hypothetical protein